MQLGTKVPLWGGFNAQGGFALRLWTPKAKMQKEEWKEHVPALKRAAATAGAGRILSCCCICLVGSGTISVYSLLLRSRAIVLKTKVLASRG